MNQPTIEKPVKIENCLCGNPGTLAHWRTLYFVACACGKEGRYHSIEANAVKAWNMCQYEPPINQQ